MRWRFICYPAAAPPPRPRETRKGRRDMQAVTFEFVEAIVELVKKHERDALVASHDPWDELVLAARTGRALRRLTEKIVALLDSGAASRQHGDKE